jgi:hypothetical protein
MNLKEIQCQGKDIIEQTQSKVQWQIWMEASTSLIAAHFLTCWVTADFSRKNSVTKLVR